MKILSVVAFLLLMVVHHADAQNRATYAPDFSQTTRSSDSIRFENDNITKMWNHLTIISDSRIDKLLEIQKEESIRKATIAGYRLQIYQGTKKDYAYQLKARFLSKFPDYKVYVLFQTPEFRVRIGDFRSRSEAIKLKYLIEKDFPNPFIVEDNINFPDIIEVNTGSSEGE